MHCEICNDAGWILTTPHCEFPEMGRDNVTAIERCDACSAETLDDEQAAILSGLSYIDVSCMDSGAIHSVVIGSS